MLLCAVQRLEWFQKGVDLILFLGYMREPGGKNLISYGNLRPIMCLRIAWALVEQRCSIFVSCAILGTRLNLAPDRAGVVCCQPSWKFTADFNYPCFYCSMLVYAFESPISVCSVQHYQCLAMSKRMQWVVTRVVRTKLQAQHLSFWDGFGWWLRRKLSNWHPGQLNVQEALGLYLLLLPPCREAGWGLLVSQSLPFNAAVLTTVFTATLHASVMPAFSPSV